MTDEDIARCARAIMAELGMQEGGLPIRINPDDLTVDYIEQGGVELRPIVLAVEQAMRGIEHPAIALRDEYEAIDPGRDSLQMMKYIAARLDR